jgi:hypothetical protein
MLGETLPPGQVSGGLGSHIHARFAAVGSVELDLPRRSEMPRAAEFPGVIRLDTNGRSQTIALLDGMIEGPRRHQ